MRHPLLRTALAAVLALTAWGISPAQAQDAAQDVLSTLQPMDTEQLNRETGKNIEDSFNVEESYNLLQSNTSDSDILQAGNVVTGNGATGMISGNQINNTAGITTLMQSTGHGNAQIYTMNVNVTLK